MSRSLGLVASGTLFTAIGARSIDVLEFLMAPSEGWGAEDIIVHTVLDADSLEYTPIAPTLSRETVLELCALAHGALHFGVALADAMLQYSGRGRFLAVRASLVTMGFVILTISIVFVAYAFQSSLGDLMR